MDTDEQRYDITVKIANQRYAIKNPRAKEELYRKAERLINEKVGYFHTAYPEHSVEKNMSLALIDVYTQLLLLEKKNDTEPYRQAMNQLTGEIETALHEYS